MILIRGKKMNFDDRARFYNRFRAEDFRLTNKIIDLLDLNLNSVVVDLGAGTGNYARELSHYFHKIYAVEPSINMMKQNKSDKIIWINSYAEKINLPNNSVDGIIIVNALHHFNDLSKVFSEISRIIKSGTLVISTFDPKICRNIWLYDYWPELRRYIDDNYLDIEIIKKIINENLSCSIKEHIFEIPKDFRDVFSSATWKRPYLLLNRKVREGMSMFHYSNKTYINLGLKKLSYDLNSGAWTHKYEKLLKLESYDVGYRLLQVKINDC